MVGEAAARDLANEILIAREPAHEARRRTAEDAGRVAIVPDRGAEDGATFIYRLDREKRRAARRREGRYLLRTNLTARDPARLGKLYVQRSEVEAAFKNLKDDLVWRPIYHPLEPRIEAHIFIACMRCCQHVARRAKLKRCAPGLTARACSIRSPPLPTADSRTRIVTRDTEPSWTDLEERHGGWACRRHWRRTRQQRR